MFEPSHQPLATHSAFFSRVAYSFLMGVFFLLLSLIAGMFGYHHFESLSWLDSFLNASMILSGMGPVASPQTVEGKIFASLYAIFSGIAFLLIMGIIAAPIIHRFLHRFHIEESKKNQRD